MKQKLVLIMVTVVFFISCEREANEIEGVWRVLNYGMVDCSNPNITDCSQYLVNCRDVNTACCSGIFTVTYNKYILDEFHIDVTSWNGQTSTNVVRNFYREGTYELKGDSIILTEGTQSGASFYSIQNDILTIISKHPNVECLSKFVYKRV